MERATFFVRGRVQGVGFRWWTGSQARELGLVGFARNLPDGGVEVCAQGERSRVERLESLLREQPSSTGRPGWVDSVTARWSVAGDDLRSFSER